MIVALIGESCTGKSTVAYMLKGKLGASVYSGKDYKRLAKNEDEAMRLFANLLQNSQDSKETIIYVISEHDDLKHLPVKALRVVLEADIETIKQRFAQRMNGNLPPAVANMLERKHAMFEGTSIDMSVSTDTQSAESIIEEILYRLEDEKTLL